MNDFASLCILAYKRPSDLMTCLNTLRKTIDYPCEIIINLDGTDAENIVALQFMLRDNKISKLILNNGMNRGVGRSFQNCTGIAEGRYIFKIDADIIFKPQWLSSTVKILENNADIGAVGLFDYNRQDPNDSRFKPENNVIAPREDCLIVKDFVSSIYAFRSCDLNKIIPIQDDGNHTKLGQLALNDKVDIHAWGVGRSVYVSGTEDHPRKTETFNEPFLFLPPEKNL